MSKHFVIRTLDFIFVHGFNKKNYFSLLAQPSCFGQHHLTVNPSITLVTQLSFIIERFNPNTGEVFETTLSQATGEQEGLSSHTLLINVSETDGLRAKLHLNHLTVFHHMLGVLLGSLLLLLITLCGIALLFRLARRNLAAAPFSISHPLISPEFSNTVYHLGTYTFDADKNELKGPIATLTLNKKERAILFALCECQGNVVERNKLLEDNWGSAGFIYSRSLDTYITKLRKYLKDDPSIQIVTIKSVGYKLIF